MEDSQVEIVLETDWMFDCLSLSGDMPFMSEEISGEGMLFGRGVEGAVHRVEPGGFSCGLSGDVSLDWGQ